MPTPEQVLQDPLMDISQNPVEKQALSGMDISATVPTRAPVPDQIAEIRSHKYDLALGQRSPGAAQIKTMINTPGGEDALRAQAASQEGEARKTASVDIFKTGDPTIDSQTMEYVARAGAQTVRPDTALEKAYAEKVLSTSLAMTDNPDEVEGGFRDTPATTHAAFDFGQGEIIRNEGFLRIQQQAEAELKAQSWAGYLADEAKNVVSLGAYGHVMNDFVNPLGYNMSSWLPGNNKEEQLAYLRAMKPEDAVSYASHIYKQLKQHSLPIAGQFAKDINGYGTGDIDNFSFAVDVLAVTPIGAVRKAVGTVVGKSLSKVTTEVTARKAISEAEKAAETLNRVPVTKDPIEVQRSLDNTMKAMESRLAALHADAAGQTPMKKAVLDNIIEANVADLEKLKAAKTEFAKHGGKASARLVERIRRTVSVASDKHLNMPEILSGSGYTAQAARIQAVEFTQKLIPGAGKSMIQDVADLVERVPSLYSPRAITIEATQFSKPRAGRLADILEYNADTAARSVAGTINAARLPTKLEQTALDAAETALRNQYQDLGKSVLYAVEKYTADTNKLTNTAYLETVFGKADGTLFASPEQALSVGKNRYGLNISERDIFQEGDGYAVRIRTDVDETTDGVRSALTDLDNQSNTGYNRILGVIPVPKAISSAKDSVSAFQAEQRAITTHATTLRAAYNKLMVQEVTKLSNQERKALTKIMEFNRDYETTPGRPDTRGMFFKTTHELEMGYLSVNNRLPTEREVAAYYSFVQNSDAQYLALASQEFTNKARKGIQRVSLKIAGGEEFSFEGKLVDSVPFDTNHPGSVYYAPNGRTSPGKYYSIRGVQDADRKAINARVKAGTLHIVQTADPEDAVLRESLGVSGPTNFVVIGDAKAGPLSFNEQLNYRPGFHVKYKDNYFVKQPRVYRDSSGRKIYGGDTVALGVSNLSKASKEAQLLESARVAVKAKDDNALRSVISDGLPLTIGEVKSLFKSKFDIDTPFAAVQSGQSAADPSVRLANGMNLEAHAGKFDDYSNSPFALHGRTSEYTAHKDGPLYSIKNDGTEDKPVWTMGEARTFDPMKTQIAAMGKLIRSKHYNDMQLASAESWVQEFGVQRGLIHLNGVPVSAADLRRNPMYYLTQGVIPAKLVGSEAATARNIQRATKNLVSHRSILANHLSAFQTKLLSAAYDYSGEGATKIVDDMGVYLSSDLPSKLRAIAFHTKLGMMNPVQIALQGQTLFNMSAIAPEHGPSATLVSRWMRSLDLIPGDRKAIEAMAEKASKITPGWTKENFTESHDLMKKTGWDLIGGDLSYRNDIADPKLFQGVAGKFLDFGAMLFNGTERFVRIAAWNTAYKEYVSKFPKLAGKLSDAEARTILSRAQDLSGNMTRDAHAFWQEGAASTVTQFLGYSARMMDLLSGKRLTVGEKTRLVTSWSLLYGLPIAATAAAPVWPLKDEVLQSLIDSGYNPDEGLAGLMLNGLVSTVIAGVTGKHLDVGSRYGPNEITVLKNLTNPPYGATPLDQIATIAMGASGSITSTIISDGLPVVKDLMDIVSGEQDDPVVLMQDANDLFGNISTWKQVDRAIAIANTGMYANKDDKVISDGLNPMDGIFHLLFGIETTDGANARAMTSLVKAKQELKTKASDKAKEYIRLYFGAVDKGDFEAARSYKKRARVLYLGGGLSEPEIAKSIKGVMKEKTVLDKAVDKAIKAGISPEAVQ